MTKNVIDSLAIMSIANFSIDSTVVHHSESLYRIKVQNAMLYRQYMCLSIIANWSCPHDPSPHTRSAWVCVWVLLQDRWSVCLWIGTAPAYQCCTIGLQCSKPHSTETTGQTQTHVSIVSTTAHLSVHVFFTKQMFPTLRSQHLLTYTSVDGWKDNVVKITIHIFYCIEKEQLVQKNNTVWVWNDMLSHTHTYKLYVSPVMSSSLRVHSSTQSPSHNPTHLLPLWVTSSPARHLTR